MHDHSHHHHHHDGASGRIATAFALNLAFTLIEFIGGVLTNSTAILADAVHDLGDTLAIALGWLLQRLGGRPASRHFTYGYQRLSLLGALINALILLEDVLGWVAVLIVSIVLQFAHWPILDPLLSIVFTLFILINVLRNLGTTLRLFLQATPDVEMNQDILQRLSALPHVTEVHHLHLWSLDGEHHVLTAHLVLDIPIDSTAYERIKQSIRDACEGCNISHTTIELEQLDEQCRDH